MNFLIVFFVLIVSAASADSLPSDPDPIESNTIERHYVVGEDDRSAMTSSEAPWSMIGKLIRYSGGKEVGHCTGGLVSRRHVVTNSHCIYGDNETEIPKGTSFRFYPNFKNGRGTLYSSPILVPKKRENGSDSDFTILMLNSALGKRFGWLGFASFDRSFYSRPGWKDNLAMAGYSSEFKGGATAGVHTGCSFIEDVPGLGFFHDCDSYSGASGSPILAWFNGKARIVGLNWGGNKKKGLNYAVYASDIYNAVKGAIAEPPAVTFLKVAASAHFCNETDKAVKFYMVSGALNDWKGLGYMRQEPRSCSEVRLTSKGDPGLDVYYYAERQTNTGSLSWPAVNGPDRAKFCTLTDGTLNPQEGVANLANCPGKAKVMYKCGETGEDSVVRCGISE